MKNYIEYMPISTFSAGSHPEINDNTFADFPETPLNATDSHYSNF